MNTATATPEVCTNQEQWPTTGIEALDNLLAQEPVSTLGAIQAAVRLATKYPRLGDRIAAVVAWQTEQKMPDADTEADVMPMREYQALVDGYEARTTRRVQVTDMAAINAATMIENANLQAKSLAYAYLKLYRHNREAGEFVLRQLQQDKQLQETTARLGSAPEGEPNDLASVYLALAAGIE